MDKHFTATVYIVSKINGQHKVLLHKHKKLNLWLGIGGHIEKGENQVDALKREVKEETNLDLSLLNVNKKPLKTNFITELPIPITILEENIPAYKNIKAHKHLDCIYIDYVKNPKKIKIKEEYGWFSKKDLDKLDLGTEVRYLGKRAPVCSRKYPTLTSF